MKKNLTRKTSVHRDYLKKEKAVTFLKLTGMIATISVIFVITFIIIVFIIIFNNSLMTVLQSISYLSLSFSVSFSLRKAPSEYIYIYIYSIKIFFHVYGYTIFNTLRVKIFMKSCIRWQRTRRIKTPDMTTVTTVCRYIRDFD